MSLESDIQSLVNETDCYKSTAEEMLKLYDNYALAYNAIVNSDNINQHTYYNIENND